MSEHNEGLHEKIESEEEKNSAQSDAHSENKIDAEIKGDNYDDADIEKNKTMAGLAYFIFFLPLFVCPESKYAKFHANQALLLFIAAVAGNVILGTIPVLGWLILPFYLIAVIALGIMGLVNGFGGKAKELPIIGKYRIIK